MTALRTLFLDAGGVLVHPSWRRVAETLGRHGVRVSAEALVAAEPGAKRAIDEGMRAGAPSRDAKRAWEYMELVLEGAGVPVDAAAAAALVDLRAYHAEHNLWEDVPADVAPALDTTWTWSGPATRGFGPCCSTRTVCTRASRRHGCARSTSWRRCWQGRSRPRPL